MILDSRMERFERASLDCSCLLLLWRGYKISIAYFVSVEAEKAGKLGKLKGKIEHLNGAVAPASF